MIGCRKLVEHFSVEKTSIPNILKDSKICEGAKSFSREGTEIVAIESIM